MDKVRAMQYFNAAAAHGSFAAAARAFEVSTPAVAQLVGALERSLGATLLHRSRQGLTLTADGARYLDSSRKLVADLEALESSFSVRRSKPAGTLTVGMRDSIGQNCVLPRIGRFLELYPDVELVLRPIAGTEDIAGKVDVAIMIGWAPERDLVVRPLAQTRLIVCASPEYWKRNGTPAEPAELERHHCLLIRSTGGTQLDRWSFEKDGRRCSVDVPSRLLSEDRGWIEEAALSGAGVVRLSDVILERHLASGALMPALSDWHALEAPMIFAAYAPQQRRSRLVRAFIDFVVDAFEDIDKARSPASRWPMRATAPDWFGRTLGRHSAYVRRRKAPR